MCRKISVSPRAIFPFGNHIADAGKGLAGIARIENDGFGASHFVNGVAHDGVGHVVAFTRIAGFNVEVGARSRDVQAEGLADFFKILDNALFFGRAEGRNGDAGQAQGRTLAPQAAEQAI